MVLCKETLFIITILSIIFDASTGSKLSGSIPRAIDSIACMPAADMLRFRGDDVRERVLGVADLELEFCFFLRVFLPVATEDEDGDGDAEEEMSEGDEDVETASTFFFSAEAME